MGPVVEVEVIGIRPNGVQVKILDDQYGHRVGFVHRRELSWDQSVSSTVSMPEEGTRFKAKVIDEKGKVVRLSKRQLTDPWSENKGSYHEGDIARGEVVNIRNFGAFVQIEPGLVARMHPRDIPLLRGQLVEDVLSIGDQVQGVIISIDPEKRQMDISLTQRLQEFSPFPEVRKQTQVNLFQDHLCPSGTENVFEAPPTTLDDNSASRRRYHPPIPSPKRLLIIDDNGVDLQRICLYLEQELGIEEVDSVRSGDEAVSKIGVEQSYDLAVIDLTLVDEPGAKVAGDLLRLDPNLAIIFMSANPLVEVQNTIVDGRQFPFAPKDNGLEEIGEWIDKLCGGYWEEIHESEKAYTGPGSFVHQLGMEALARRALPEMLRKILSRFRQETRVSHTLVLEVDSVGKDVSLIIAEPPLEENAQRVFLDGLYYSPVSNVVEDEEEFYSNHIRLRNPRFKYFHPLVFKSCLGIPLRIPDLVIRHALFIVDEQPELAPEDIDKARMTAGFIQVALERALLLDYMGRYEQRYSLGQLLGSLVHELTNKLDGLGGQIETLPVILGKANSSTESIERSRWLGEAMEVSNDLTSTKEDLGELVNAYSRMARGELEAVDVNDVVRKVKIQLETKARETSVEVYLEEGSGLPLAQAIQSRLEQIVANLVLNAIQQIGQQLDFMEQVAQEKGETVSIMQNGLVIVQTQYNEAKDPYPIKITVIDTGPGIHYHRQGNLFLLDTSTRRKGHGLGLYISQNLAETMGGRIRLVDSMMFIGTKFVVELPVFSESGG